MSAGCPGRWQACLTTDSVGCRARVPADWSEGGPTPSSMHGGWEECRGEGQGLKPGVRLESPRSTLDLNRTSHRHGGSGFDRPSAAHHQERSESSTLIRFVRHPRSNNPYSWEPSGVGALANTTPTPFLPAADADAEMEENLVCIEIIWNACTDGSPNAKTMTAIQRAVSRVAREGWMKDARIPGVICRTSNGAYSM